MGPHHLRRLGATLQKSVEDGSMPSAKETAAAHVHGMVGLEGKGGGGDRGGGGVKTCTEGPPRSPGPRIISPPFVAAELPAQSNPPPPPRPRATDNSPSPGQPAPE